MEVAGWPQESKACQLRSSNLNPLDYFFEATERYWRNTIQRLEMNLSIATVVAAAAMTTKTSTKTKTKVTARLV